MERLGMPGFDHAAIQERPPDLAELRAQVRAIERGGAGRSHSVISLGAPTLDGCLAGGGLALGRVHEVIGETRSEVRDAAAFGFVIALLARLLKTRESDGEVLWCPRGANPYGGMLSARGLVGLGLDPGRIIIAEARGEADRLWAMEEGLGCSGLAAVVAELGPARPGAGSKDTVSCRRLQLAAEASGVTGILLRPDAGAAASAVGTPESRWRVTSNFGREEEAEIGRDWRPRWHAELLRARNGRPGDANLIWDAERGIFREVDPLSVRRQPLGLLPRISTFAERSAA
jgi:protein ImuA